MCDPATAAGLALSAAGTYMQTREANSNAKSVQNAKNSVYEANMIRQKQYADEAGAAFDRNIGQQGSDNFAENQDADQAKFKQAFSDIRTQPTYNQGLAASAPKNVVLARQNASDKAGAETDRDVEGLSRLASYGNASFNQNLGRNEYARLFGNLQDKASRDSNLLGLDLKSAANNAQKGTSAFPALLKAAGQAVGMANAGGYFKPETVAWNPSTSITGGQAINWNPSVSTFNSPFKNDLSKISGYF